jgi:TonB family protein
MKAGLATSVILHAALIGFGLVTLSAPRSLEVADVEAFPIDIVPLQEITQIQQGEKKAVKKEKSAPIPSEKPDIVRDAKKIGEADVDSDTKPTPEPKQRPVEARDAPPPSPEPAPKPDTELAKEPAKQPEQKPAAAPATEVAAIPQPKQEVTPDPVAEAIVAETPDAEKADLPETAPTPQARPKQPQAETAKAPDRKETEKPVTKQAAKPKSEEPEFNADEVAALLDKQKPSGGGADRSHDEASLGGEKTTTGQKLSQSEMDALRGQLQGCWTIPVGAEGSENLRVSVKFNLDPGSGKLEGMPRVEQSSGNRPFDESAVRAVQKCDRDGLMVPKDKPEVWAEVIVNFDPSEMF